jgi:hypothetical protein
MKEVNRGLPFYLLSGKQKTRTVQMRVFCFIAVSKKGRRKRRMGFDYK